MKKYLSLSLIILVFLFTQCKPKDTGAVVIGVDLPLTGAFDYWGNEFKTGAEVFCKQHPEVKVLFEDNLSSPDEALTVAGQLLHVEKADALVSLFVPFSTKLRTRAESAQVPLITSFISASDFTDGYSFCFNDFATNAMQLPLLVDCVTDSLNLHRGIYYCVNDDYGTDGAKILSQLMGAKGIALSGELFNAGTSDHRNTLAKLMKEKVDFVFLIARNRDLINAINQIRERDKDVLILGVGSFDAPEVWDGVPAASQANILFASSYFHKDYNEESRAFYDAFYEIRRRDPNYPAVFGYTICQYLSACITKAKEQNVPLTDILESLDYESIRGRIRMTDNHIVYSPVAIYKREGGVSVPIATEMERPAQE